MSGTRAGGLKARDKNKELYGNDWYSKIGKIGGKKCGMKGFALNHELAVKAGRKGGLVSKRGKSIKKYKDGE